MEMAQDLINAGVDVGYFDDDGRTILHVGAPRKELTALYIRAISNPYMKGCDEIDTPLVYSLMTSRNYENVRWLLDAGMDPFYEDLAGLSVFHHILHSRALQELHILLGHLPDLNLDHTFSEGKTLLHLAASIGWFEGCEMLINYGARLDITDAKGRPLFMNAIEGFADDVIDLPWFDISCVEWNVQDADGITTMQVALMVNADEVLALAEKFMHPDLVKSVKTHDTLRWAIDNRHSNVIQRLQKMGICAEELNYPHGRTALHHAVSLGDFELVETLFSVVDESKMKKWINTRDNESGFSALHLLLEIRSDPFKEALLLIQYGADVNLTDSKGQTVLHHAAQKHDTRLTQFLLEKTVADPNMQDIQGNTPLHLACFNYKYGTAEELLEHGADLTLANNQGLTAKGIAINEDLDEVLEAIQTIEKMNMKKCKSDRKRGLLCGWFGGKS